VVFVSIPVGFCILVTCFRAVDMEKIYVIDTNVLLHDPMALYAFKEYKIVIPMTVLEELDTIKDRKDKEVSREARIAIHAIDSVITDASPKAIQEGVDIPGSNLHGASGTLAIFPDQLISHDNKAPYLGGSPQQANDNRIINVALHIQANSEGCYVCLVTKDINMRLKDKGSGLEHVEDYRKDRVIDDIDLLSKDYENITGDFWTQVESVRSVQRGRVTMLVIDRSVLPDAYPQMFVCDNGDFVGLVKQVDASSIHIQQLSREHLMAQEMWGLTPRNFEQAMAFFLVQADDLDMTVLTGPAGSGKTLISPAYGLHAIMEEKRYDKLIVARSTPPIAADIGFLPGTEEEKMAPWLAAFEDNLEVLHGND
jgi:PhoH-like ATPase